MTFKQCADAYLAIHEAGWKNPKHRQQWRNTLDTYVHPVIGSLSVQAVDVPLVLKCCSRYGRRRPCGRTCAEPH